MSLWGSFSFTPLRDINLRLFFFGVYVCEVCTHEHVHRHVGTCGGQRTFTSSSGAALWGVLVCVHECVHTEAREMYLYSFSILNLKLINFS